MRDARPLFEWYTRHAVQHCALVLSLVPEDMLADRDQLSACLTEELDDLSRRLVDYLDSIGIYIFPVPEALITQG